MSRFLAFAKPLFRFQTREFPDKKDSLYECHCLHQVRRQFSVDGFISVKSRRCRGTQNWIGRRLKNPAVNFGVKSGQCTDLALCNHTGNEKYSALNLPHLSFNTCSSESVPHTKNL